MLIILQTFLQTVKKNIREPLPFAVWDFQFSMFYETAL